MCCSSNVEDFKWSYWLRKIKPPEYPRMVGQSADTQEENISKLSRDALKLDFGYFNS